MRLSLETENREGQREEGRAPRSKTGSLCKVQVGPNLGAVSGQGSELDPCLARVQK
jgi:hypothetical protein